MQNISNAEVSAPRRGRRFGVMVIGPVVGLVVGLGIVVTGCATPPGVLAPGRAAGSTGQAGHGSIALRNLGNTATCDPLDTRHCLLPFPSNTFTVEDRSTGTGRRINFARSALPTNAGGVQVDPAEWNRNDGFSPGQAISVFIPGVDLAASKLNDVTNIEASLRSDAGVVLLDATTGQRWPYWAELDSSVSDANDQVLYVRPARNYPDGHRMVVGFRNLIDVHGAMIPANDVFRAYRDRLHTNVEAVERQRNRYERVLNELGSAGVARDSSLFIGWDFTVASTRNLSERMLHIRDVAFAQLGSGAPAFTVDLVEDNPDVEIVRRVTGTFDVPLFLDQNGVSGSRFLYGSNGLPVQTGTYKASYICNIPHAALIAPGRAGVYGHGLLGSNDEVSAGNVRAMSEEHNFVFCATKWIGLSDEDVGNAIATLSDMSNMVTEADRLQQGMLNTIVLARLVKSPAGLVTNAAFQTSSGTPVIATGAVYYDGNSQGGVMGGGVTAVSAEWTRAVLGVSGMNYSTLLQRSVDWNTYRAVYDPSYPNVIERGIGLSLLQMLWDRGEANGYANHITGNPLPGTPRHKVLMEIGIGDFQVSNWAALVEARTIGARLGCPATIPRRFAGVDPMWGVPCMDPTRDNERGSAIVFWDSGTPAPPLGNVAPSSGVDSHEDPRADAKNRAQKSHFLGADGAGAGNVDGSTGTIVDVCNAQPCTANSVG